jgi:hypothetical protein
MFDIVGQSYASSDLVGNTTGINNFDSSRSDEAIYEKSKEFFQSCFYENTGQIENDEVKFYGRIPGVMIGFAEGKILLRMHDSSESIVLKFENFRYGIPHGIEEISHRTNYFLGDRGTYTNIKGFTKISYCELWPGISVLFQATNDGAKYEFQVEPGSNPSNIQMHCERIDSLEVLSTSVVIRKGNCEFVDSDLRVFQENDEIQARFVARGAQSFGFEVGSYDQSKMLTIDPLLYSTFIGGNEYDNVQSMAIDASGNVYVTGHTYSSDFPTLNASDSSHNGESDCFVFKLSSTGDTLLYSTFVGGSAGEEAYGLSVDSSGNAYVTGWTFSPDFPTVNAYDDSHSHPNNNDCFVLKLAANGSTLLYSTFVGVSIHPKSIAVDTSGNAFVTGGGLSVEYGGELEMVNAYDDTYNGNEDGFVFELNPTGNSLLYSTFLGGSNWDTGYSIAVDPSGNIYVAGLTDSTNFPVVNAYENEHSGMTDCFILKFNASGDTLLYSTFIGGSDEEEIPSLSVDSSGNAYVSGSTQSSDFPMVNPLDSTLDGMLDSFVLKLSAAGDTLLYSTYIGGSDDDYGKSIVVDASGNAFVTGSTISSDFPTVNAYDWWIGGYQPDSFVFKLAANGTTLYYSTYVGGGEWDEGVSIAVDSSGNAYVAGRTESGDFPIVNAYDESHNGAGDCFVFKVNSTGSASPYAEPPTTTPTTPSASDFDMTFIALFGGIGIFAFLVLAVVFKITRVGVIDQQAEVQIPIDDYIKQARSLITAGNLNEAKELFTRATLETPQQTDGWRGLGLTLVKLGSYEEALESLDRALDLDIGIAECWYLKAQALSRLGDDNGAIQALRRAISLNDRSRQLARTESAFNPLRTNPTFQELIEE